MGLTIDRHCDTVAPYSPCLMSITNPWATEAGKDSRTRHSRLSPPQSCVQEVTLDTYTGSAAYRFDRNQSVIPEVPDSRQLPLRGGSARVALLDHGAEFLPD